MAVVHRFHYQLMGSNSPGMSIALSTVIIDECLVQRTHPSDELLKTEAKGEDGRIITSTTDPDDPPQTIE